MSCNHVRDFDLSIMGAHPGDYYSKCLKCGKYLLDRVGGSIVKDPAQVLWEFKRLKSNGIKNGSVRITA